MNSRTKLILKKIRSHIMQLIGLILLLTVGVCFFITLFTIVLQYEKTAEQYITNNAYADVTFYGTFDDESIQVLSEQNGVLSAKGRTVCDYREGERIFRAISLTDGINIPYIYDGRLPADESECIILKRNADAMNLSIGDTLTLLDKTLIITGLAASPEYIYMVQNERTTMAKADHFGVVYVHKGFYMEEYAARYNEIVMLNDGDFSIDDAMKITKATNFISMKEQINHYLYLSDLGEIRSFAYIFPSIFAVLIAVVIYVMLSRAIQKDRTQIGIMKALGASNGNIIEIYLSQFCIAALIGVLIGCLASVFICDIIIGIFSSMFVVPTLTFAFYPKLWLMTALVSVLLCAISGLISLYSILPLLPVHAIRRQIPKGGRSIFIERIGFIWKCLSFNTRYALKNLLRNKGRFLAVVLGMCGSLALFAFSLGFYDSIGNTQDKYFNSFANYDVIVSFNLMPIALEHPAAKQIDINQKVLILPVDILGENYVLAVTENDFDMVNISNEELRKGVIVPEYFADMWSLKTGDNMQINGYNVIISAVIPQYIGLTLYTSFEYITSITDEVPEVYNTVYGRSEDMSVLSSYLKDNNIDFTTIDDDKTSFDSIMESMSVLIWFMIACSVVLGFTVLYSVGLINLSAREYEYMFMGVMGYSHISIMKAHIKENLLQLVLAIPLGFLLAELLLGSIKGEFSGSNFVISSVIYLKSFIISALSVIGITALMAVVTSRHIGKLSIVEGLKVQND